MLDAGESALTTGSGVGTTGMFTSFGPGWALMPWMPCSHSHSSAGELRCNADYEPCISRGPRLPLLASQELPWTFRVKRLVP